MCTAHKHTIINNRFLRSNSKEGASAWTSAVHGDLQQPIEALTSGSVVQHMACTNVFGRILYIMPYLMVFNNS